MICNLGVVGSNPSIGSKFLERDNAAVKKKILGRYQSGQMGQTVNLLVFTFGGSNPSLPTHRRKSRASNLQAQCGSSSVDRALAFQAKGREFEPRLPL